MELKVYSQIQQHLTQLEKSFVLGAWCNEVPVHQTLNVTPASNQFLSQPFWSYGDSNEPRLNIQIDLQDQFVTSLSSLDLAFFRIAIVQDPVQEKSKFAPTKVTYCCRQEDGLDHLALIFAMADLAADAFWESSLNGVLN